MFSHQPPTKLLSIIWHLDQTEKPVCRIERQYDHDKTRLLCVKRIF